MTIRRLLKELLRKRGEKVTEFENVIEAWTHKDCPALAEKISEFLGVFNMEDECLGKITNIRRQEYDEGYTISIEITYDDGDILEYPLNDKTNAPLQVVKCDCKWDGEFYFSDRFFTINQMQQCVSMIWPKEFEADGMCLTYMKHIDINHATYKYYPKNPNELIGWEYIVTLSRKDISKLIENRNIFMDVMFHSIINTDMAPWDIGRRNPDE